MLYAKNDSQRIKDELVAIKKHNKPLYDLIIDLYKWIDKEFSKDTIITMIYRNSSEQDATYSFSDKYKKKPWKSPHQFWQACDLRVWIYTDEEIDKIVKYLNNKYNNSNYYRWTAKDHKVGSGASHFHIQYYKK